MAFAGAVFQWDLFWADLNPAIGREQSGDSRPVLIVSNDGFNRAFDVVTVLPITKLAGKKRQVYPFEVLLPAGSGGNDLDSVIMPQQIRTISKTRLLEKIGTLKDSALRTAVEDRILDHLGISLDEDPAQLITP
ncbi:MAG: type II toxin-antitoxin system PemK/MazF family toxin [Gemmatimonadaceae bacterium]|nr:type II toxin-antitoxin system PemK/MazF family toxin [Gemmatimonadaceae bacterium]